MDRTDDFCSAQCERKYIAARREASSRLLNAKAAVARAMAALEKAQADYSKF
jgi:hypothetical protein